jgi:hypothetical protein
MKPYRRNAPGVLEHPGAWPNLNWRSDMGSMMKRWLVCKAVLCLAVGCVEDTSMACVEPVGPTIYESDGVQCSIFEGFEVCTDARNEVASSLVDASVYARVGHHLAVVLEAEGFEVAECMKQIPYTVIGFPTDADLMEWCHFPWVDHTYSGCYVQPGQIGLSARNATSALLVAHEFAHAAMVCHRGDGDPRHENEEVWDRLLYRAIRADADSCR